LVKRLALQRRRIAWAEQQHQQQRSHPLPPGPTATNNSWQRTAVARCSTEYWTALAARLQQLCAAALWGPCYRKLAVQWRLAMAGSCLRCMRFELLCGCWSVYSTVLHINCFTACTLEQ
jgi:hypothetical protein